MHYPHRLPVPNTDGFHPVMHRSIVRVDDQAETYAVLGRGSPVVFLPRRGLTPWVYQHALARLARSCRVYAPVVPGLAEASNSLARMTLADRSTWLGRFLDAVGLGSVTLIAHSFGGALAIKAAHDLPERVVRLVLVNSVGGGRGTGRQELGVSTGKEAGTVASGEVRSPRMRASISPSCTIATRNEASEPESAGRTVPAPRDRDLNAELNRLAQRRLFVSLVWSREDRLIPRASVEALRDVLGRPPVFIVPGGHGWPITAPECFGNAMRTVLAGFPIEVAS